MEVSSDFSTKSSLAYLASTNATSEQSVRRAQSSAAICIMENSRLVWC